jgi:hypothetical protein
MTRSIVAVGLAVCLLGAPSAVAAQDARPPVGAAPITITPCPQGMPRSPVPAQFRIPCQRAAKPQRTPTMNVKQMVGAALLGLLVTFLYLSQARSGG